MWKRHGSGADPAEQEEVAVGSGARVDDHVVAVTRGVDIAVAAGPAVEQVAAEAAEQGVGAAEAQERVGAFVAEHPVGEAVAGAHEGRDREEKKVL